MSRLAEPGAAGDAPVLAVAEAGDCAAWRAGDTGFSFCQVAAAVFFIWPHRPPGLQHDSDSISCK